MPVDDFAGAVHDIQDGTRRHTFAAAAFPYHAQRSTAPDGITRAVNSLYNALAGEKVHLEVTHFQ
jgi:hypothetical protein